MNRAVLVLAVLFAAVAIWTLASGPWRIDVASVRLSASSADKPASLAALFLLAASLTSRWFHRMIGRGSTGAFYALTAGACWVLSWGPFPRLFGEPVLYQAPYAWLLQLPGADAVRAPARFWMLTVVCLAVCMGIGLERILASRSRRAAVAVVVAAALGLLADGWTTIRAAPVPPGPSVDLPHTALAIRLPMHEPSEDIAASYHAVTGGYRAVNGYSGYEPPHYEALRTLAGMLDERMFAPFVAREPLNVLVGGDPRVRQLLERQPGARFVSDGVVAHYRLPAGGMMPRSVEVSGARLDVRRLDASCSAEQAGRAIDGDPLTAWWCGSQTEAHVVTADLGRAATVGAVVHALGPRGSEFPRRLAIDTSIDGTVWEPAWEGSPAWPVLQAALAAPRETRATIGFDPRAARYVRLRQQAVSDARHYWSIAELEVWGRAD